MHWTEQNERSGYTGIAILLFLMRWTGPGFIRLLVFPVVAVFFFTSPRARAASADYLKKLQRFARDNRRRLGQDLPNQYTSGLTFRHFLSFARSFVNRVHAWSAGSRSLRYKIEGQKYRERILYQADAGGVLMVSHLGNFDMVMALGEQTPNKQFIIFHSGGNARKYEKLRNKLLKYDRVSFVDPNDIDPIKLIHLKHEVEEGAVVVIAGDRTSRSDSLNTTKVEFLGAPATFPSGPYIMAALLEVPVYSLFVFDTPEGFLIRMNLFARQIIVPRRDRAKAVSRYAHKFADRLEEYCLEFPFQWYNFYDFWSTPDGNERNHRDTVKRLKSSEQYRNHTGG